MKTRRSSYMKRSKRRLQLWVVGSLWTLGLGSIAMHPNHERGNVLVSSLLILLVMNLLGIGLVQASIKESSMATYKTVNAEVFHLSESCTQDVINWFESQNTTPSSTPGITNSDLSFMYTGSESTTQLNKLQGYSYNCNTTFLISKSGVITNPNISTNVEIGNAGGEYSAGSSLSIKDYYQIVSNSAGPKNASKTINTIISVEY